MIGILLRCVAFILFVLVGFNQTLFGKSGLELGALGLACWVLATLIGDLIPTFESRGGP